MKIKILWYLKQPIYPTIYQAISSPLALSLSLSLTLFHHFSLTLSLTLVNYDRKMFLVEAIGLFSFPIVSI